MNLFSGKGDKYRLKTAYLNWLLLVIALIYVRIILLTKLVYTGVLETTRIRREGYAVRIPFADFVERLVSSI